MAAQTSPGPIGRALSGALALARFDARGMERFDFSVDGFWRSFDAIALCLPVVLATAALTPALVGKLAALNPDLAKETVNLPDNLALYLVFETLAFAAGWAFFPLAMIPAARLLDLGKRYVPLIVAVNWTRVIGAWTLRLPVLLFAAGLIDAGLLSFLWFVAVLYLFALFWFVMRVATGTSGGTVLGLLLLDILGTLLAQTLVGQIYWLLEPSAPPANT